MELRICNALEKILIKNFRLLHEAALLLESRLRSSLGAITAAKTSLTEVMTRLLDGRNPTFRLALEGTDGAIKRNA
jgi:putative ATP-dependent endonuclease of OLD family